MVLTHGEGAWVTDVDGRRYLDCLAGYSALNFGHGHPRLVARAQEQLDRLTLTSRAFHNDQLGPFAEALAGLTGKDMILPMNTGAEAVETALKVARKWGYRVKGVPEDTASIVVMEGNFHGRTTTIVSFSDDKIARDEYGPYTPGFRTVTYGDADALRHAVDDTTVAVLLEPVQGEGGVVIPPEGYLREVRAICDEAGVLMIADEIQSGLARTGRTFACDHEDVVPDIYVLGKALGGGLYPVSAIAADREVLEVITPGLARLHLRRQPARRGHRPRGRHHARRGRVPAPRSAARRSARRPARPARRPTRRRRASRPCASAGLWAGLDIEPGGPSGRELCERLMSRGILAKDTHGSTIRIAPPLVVTEDEVGLLVDAVADALAPTRSGRRRAGRRRARRAAGRSARLPPGDRLGCRTCARAALRAISSTISARRGPGRSCAMSGNSDQPRARHGAGRRDAAARHHELVAQAVDDQGRHPHLVQRRRCGRGWPGWRPAAGSCPAG